MDRRGGDKRNRPIQSPNKVWLPQGGAFAETPKWHVAQPSGGMRAMGRSPITLSRTALGLADADADAECDDDPLTCF
jgi:hypothetical protein